ITMDFFVNIIGAGIFVAPKGVLKYSCMNVGLSLCIWAGCALLPIMTSLCSAAIGITFSCCGAHYYCLKSCFSNLISFLNLWITLFLGPGLAASQALLLAAYSIQPFYPSCSVPKLPKKYLALAILWIVGILNFRGVKEVTWLQISSTVLKMAILGLISLSGVNSFGAEFPEASRFIEAVFQGYFSYSGGGCSMYIAGELKKPRKTVLKCIFTAFPLVTIVYFLVNISYLTVLTPKEILSSGLYSYPLINMGYSFGISASLFSNLLINVFESSRVIYIAGQEGQLPLLFNTLNIYSSPFISVLLLVIIASIAVVLKNLIDLINYLYIVVSIWSALSMTGILKLRYQKPNLPRPYKVFLPFLLAAIAISLCLVLIPLVKFPHMYYIYVCLFILSGLLFYIPLIYFKLRLLWFEKMTCYLQLLFNICIPEVSDEQMSEVEVGTVKKK
uniref:Solute carrier family 7 member 13 n=1 Tax=Balaenoptera musculus TaxID=9771 RepID=A0A8C0E0V6_BALMU